ncbi:MAG: metal-dependent transcriptional regulator [Chloroflexi bacterium]|nr:metal-dependent transcriptional regulator [Chloroflexota bacterium]
MSVILDNLSSNMEMYLLKLKRLESQAEPVPLSLLAESLGISPVSVNEMCRKLSEMELIEYLPYKGASLTGLGKEYSQRVLRKHQLWEKFLVDHLQLGFDTAHEFADELEHATSDLLAEKLERFLGKSDENFPCDQKGNNETPFKTHKLVKLTSVDSGSNVKVVYEGLEKSVESFLRSSGICDQSIFIVEGKNKVQMLLSCNGEFFSLSTNIADQCNVVWFSTENEVSTYESDFVKKKESMENLMTEGIIVKTNLREMKIGQKAIVLGVRSSGSTRQRMMDMGLVPGSEIEVMRIAPLGDPIEINLKGYHLSLRKSEAKEVEVEIIREEE